MTNGHDPVNAKVYSTDVKGEVNNNNGISKREYFAAMAMQSILTYSKNPVSTIAKDAVKAADALISELNKPANT